MARYGKDPSKKKSEIHGEKLYYEWNSLWENGCIFVDRRRQGGNVPLRQSGINFLSPQPQSVESCFEKKLGPMNLIFF
jgi:hypothetical protein